MPISALPQKVLSSSGPTHFQLAQVSKDFQSIADDNEQWADLLKLKPQVFKEPKEAKNLYLALYEKGSDSPSLATCAVYCDKKRMGMLEDCESLQWKKEGEAAPIRMIAEKMHQAGVKIDGENIKEWLERRENGIDERDLRTLQGTLVAKDKDEFDLSDPHQLLAAMESLQAADSRAQEGTSSSWYQAIKSSIREFQNEFINRMI